MRKKKPAGQGLIEYLILVCLIAVSAIGIVSAVGKVLKQQYANISRAVAGKEKVRIDNVKEDLYRGKGMDNFMDSSRDSEK